MSTSEKSSKKELSQSQGSVGVDVFSDEKSDEADIRISDKRGTKRSSSPIPEVHSANNWESADLGDDDRKSKFLRLMGAGKKEHKGRITIGDHNPVHAISRDDYKKIETDLEQQFEEGREHKLLEQQKKAKHVGLGFRIDEDQNGKEEKSATKSLTTNDEKVAESLPQSTEDGTASTSDKESSVKPASKIQPLSFVKSDSNL